MASIVLGWCAADAGAQPVRINEIRIDQSGTDNDEYFELSGPPGMSLDGLTYVVVGDGAGAAASGVVEVAISLTGLVIPPDGYFLACEDTMTLVPLSDADLVLSGAGNGLNFENSDNLTHYLVRGWLGVPGMDLDADNNCVIDGAPWSDTVDRVSMVETAIPPTATGDECWYALPMVGPDGVFVPGHIYRCPNNGGPWAIGPFSPFTDTPGSANVNCPCLCPGDRNGDGLIDMADVPGYVGDLLSAGYEPCADLSGNGTDDGDDIRLMVAAVFDNGGTGRSCFAPRLLDAWETTADPAFPSHYSFANNPIPADFFSPGSEPFGGIVFLSGAPLDFNYMGPTDTIVERLVPFSGAPVETVPIEIVALSLVSINPITVTYPSAPPEQWIVGVGLSDTTPPVGQLTRQQSSPNGGFFIADVPVQPVFSFVSLEDLIAYQAGNIPADQIRVRSIDTAEVGQPPLIVQFEGQPSPYVNRVCAQYREHHGLFSFDNGHQDQFGFIPGLIGKGDPCNVFKPGPMKHVDPSESHYIEPPNRSPGGMLKNRCEYIYSGVSVPIACPGGCPPAPPKVWVKPCTVNADCPLFHVRMVKCAGGGTCLQLYWLPLCLPC